MQNYSEKVKLVNNENFGRHLVASMGLAPGDVVLTEQPLLVAPHWECEQMKCASCMQDSFLMCKKCQFFPLCIDCETHDAFDCDFFSGCAQHISKNLLVKNYAIYTVLKLLLLMENPQTSECCNAFTAAGADAEQQRNSSSNSCITWQEHEARIVAPLLQSGIASTMQRVKLTAELLHSLCCRIDANAFEVTGKDGDSLKGVYVGGSQLPHNCVPNTIITFDDEFRMKIYASVAIPVGAIIYNSYTNPLMGTSQRLHDLHLTKRITCKCQRCSDPTELGTHMSSLICKNCADGNVVCETPMGKGDDSWKCRNCNVQVEAAAVKQLLMDVGEELMAASDDYNAYERLLRKYGKHFHPNHFVLVDIKQNIASILRAILMNPMCVPGRDLLQRKVQLCEELLPLVRAVLPGISKLYGIALYEYLLSFIELAELEYEMANEEQQLPNATRRFKEKLEKAKEIAAEAEKMLFFEPSNSPEGHLLSRIAMEQRRIEQDLKKINQKLA